MFEQQTIALIKALVFTNLLEIVILCIVDQILNWNYLFNSEIIINYKTYKLSLHVYTLKIVNVYIDI